MSSLNYARGFSLIELLIILTLLAIFAGIAIPNFQQMIQTNRAQGAAEELLAQLQYARSEAVLRNQVVVVENLSNVDGLWSGQLRIYASYNQTANRNFSTGNDTELRIHQGIGGTSTINAQGDARLQRWISFRPNGTLSLNGSASIAVCSDPDRPDRGRQLNLEPSGRVALPSAVPATCTP